ncbi:hypothetical protein [Spirosoma foliorum]|uniref:Lipoprotein n=1 Tax=Spirosoma foliorum TaxID=2710596 RepID=A0A7G5H2V3_9BACT|nr:hypothetical protein [Spirosoma foliorum]QMW05445.1 hypothetical protein H3H32_11410 [Spirosoma foliorum]
MKRFSIFTIITFTAFACNTERQSLAPISTGISTESGSLRQSGKIDISSFSRLQKISLVSKLQVSLKSLDGVEINDVSLLQPNTTYRLNLEGQGANKVQIRACFGFTLISSEEKLGGNQITASYLIKTLSDVSDPLMISFLPIRTVGTATFREQAQNFWLAKK